MATAEFDRRFDDGEDLSGQVDWDAARRINQEPRRVNVDFPTWMVVSLDREAGRIGVSRQALIKVWIAERPPRSPRPSSRRRQTGQGSSSYGSVASLSAWVWADAMSERRGQKRWRAVVAGRKCRGWMGRLQYWRGRSMAAVPASMKG
jgi:hypothetical protein